MTNYAHLVDGIYVAAAERLDEVRTQSATDPGRTRRSQALSRCTGRHQETPAEQGFLNELAWRFPVGVDGLEPPTSAL